MDKMYSNKLIIFLFMLPVSVLFLFFVPIPVAFLFIVSFFKWDMLSPLQFVGFQNYVNLFTTDSYFGIAIKNNMIWLVLGMLIQLVPAFILAIILHSNMKGRDFFRSVIFMPMAMSSTAVSMIWYFVYHQKIGVLNQLIRAAGFNDFDYAWLMDERIALYAVLLVVGWQWAGYYMVLFLAGLSTIPSEISEAATIDGASKWQVLKNITVPYLIPVFKVTTVLTTVSSFKGFDAVYVMTGGGPGKSTTLLALHMFDMSFVRGLYGYGSSVAVIIMLLCIFSSLVLNKIFERNSMEG